MKYRSKLYISLVGTAVVSTAVGLSITYFHVKKLILKELHSKATSIAATGAASVDLNSLLQLKKNPSQYSSSYLEIQKELRAVRDINRRDDIYVKYVYILQPVDLKSDEFSYLVDAEESNSKDFSPPGEIASEVVKAKLNKHVKQLYSPSRFITDEWGDWLMGYAPILDSKGNYLATVGVNIYASMITAKLNRLFVFGLFSFGITLVLALVVGWFLSRHETESLDQLHRGVKAIDKGDLSQKINISGDDEFSELAREINNMAQGLQERERLRLSFTRYVSQHIMESIIKSEDSVKLSGERRKITLLFSDIRQFTKLSEKSNPEQVVSLLNEYFSVMVDVIFRNHGMLDKFLGDGIMVEFGAPLDDPLQEYHAVKAALEMQDELATLKKRWLLEGKPQIDIGIGIHTGLAVIGNIGSEKRIDYTAIGDTVNVASRLEQFTKQLKVPLLISEATVAAVRDQFNFTDLGAHVLRGRTDPISVYTIERTEFNQI